MRLDQMGQALIHLLPDLGRHHRFEWRVRDFEGEIAFERWQEEAKN